MTISQGKDGDGLLSSLQRLGLTEYESKAYVGLMSLGTCDARALCTRSGVPSSKIYSILEKFELLGLVEIQQSKPLRFKAQDPSIGIERLVKNKEQEVLSIRDTLPLLENQLESVFSRRSVDSSASPSFFNIQFGMKDHIQKHLPHLATARKQVLSYFETTCLQGARIYGHTVKQDIIKNILRNNLNSKVLFGTDKRKLVEGFLKGLPDLTNLEVKVTTQIHAPFHVIDGNSAIIVVDNPLFRDGRIASIHVIDKSLASELREGYRSLWESAKSI